MLSRLKCTNIHSGFQELDNREELKFKLKKLLREKSDGFSTGKGEEDKVIFIDFNCHNHHKKKIIVPLMIA